MNQKQMQSIKKLMQDMRTEPVTDMVNQPPHYTSGGIETIDYMRAKMTPEEYRGFLKGNAIKYLSRAEMKGGAEDYKKAQWYINKLVEAGETK